MEEIIDVDGIISVAVGFSNKIKEVKDAGYNFRKGSKQNFNFFSAIVTSNDEKEHLEKYHSNFIGYLLNPKASHDCESLFLKSFFDSLIILQFFIFALLFFISNLVFL